MATVLIDYGSGNLRSAAKAFERAAREAGIDTEVLVTSDADRVRAAERVVLPGVGAIADCRREFETVAGLDWIPGEVVAITPADPALKIPHMGWNDLAPQAKPHPVLEGIAAGEHAYFVHSYRFACRERRDVLATVDYAGEIVAAVGRDNLVGTQFHPEKSQATGLRLITNFLRWRP